MPRNDKFYERFSNIIVNNGGLGHNAKIKPISY